MPAIFDDDEPEPTRRSRPGRNAVFIILNAEAGY